MSVSVILFSRRQPVGPPANSDLQGQVLGPCLLRVCALATWVLTAGAPTENQHDSFFFYQNAHFLYINLEFLGFRV